MKLTLYCFYDPQNKKAITFDKNGNLWSAADPPNPSFPQEEFPDWWIACGLASFRGAHKGYNLGHKVIIKDFYLLNKPPYSAAYKALENLQKGILYEGK